MDTADDLETKFFSFSDYIERGCAGYVHETGAGGRKRFYVMVPVRKDERTFVEPARSEAGGVQVFDTIAKAVAVLVWHREYEGFTADGWVK